MKHHLYQIYYGGFKEKLDFFYFCKTCGDIIVSNSQSNITSITSKHHKKLYGDKIQLNPDKKHRQHLDK